MFKFIFLLAVILRISLLLTGKQIVDPEVATWSDAVVTDAKDLMTGNYPYFTFHNFLYYLFLKVWTEFSNNSTWLRIPSVLFGTLELVIFYKLLLYIFNKRIAQISSLLFSVSAYQLFWSIQVRPYPLVMLFGLIYAFFFITSLRKYHFKPWLLLGVIGFIGFLVDFSFFWIYFCLNFFVTLKLVSDNKLRKNLLKYWLISNSLTLLLFLPYLIKFVILTIKSPNFSVRSMIQIINPEGFVLMDVISVLYLFLTNSAVDYYDYFNIFYVFVLLSLLIYGSSKIIKHYFGLFFILLSVLPLASLVLFGILFHPILVDYQIMISSVGLLVILGFLFSEYKNILFLFLPMFLIINSWEYFNFLTMKDKENWNGAISFLSTELSANDFISFYPMNYYYESYNYYSLKYNYHDWEKANLILIEDYRDLDRVLYTKKNNKFCYFVLNDHNNEQISKLLYSGLFDRQKFGAINIFCKKNNY